MNTVNAVYIIWQLVLVVVHRLPWLRIYPTVYSTIERPGFLQSIHQLRLWYYVP